ncbi:OmpA/MotB family protein [Paenalcaligenes faecalis]|uniref:OmpA/MotB family protein n=1 Tax=Paenalcaligenes faecalis TaxID=2980099 RepID=UPI0022B96223|nr:OmpA family protein [Paenalcaligenes faecalis]
MRKYQPQAPVDEENPYWMSFSDIMSALVVIFILAAVVLMVQLMETEDELQDKVQELDSKVQLLDEEIEILQQAEYVRRTIIEEATEELKQRGIPIVMSENATVLRIPNHLLGFDTADYEIQEAYQDTAYQIGEVLHKVMTKGNRADYLDTVFVEGHTDNRPFNGFMGKGNWGLSTFRAISLWQFWNSHLPEASRLDNLRNSDQTLLFSVSGYGDTRPVTEEQNTEEELSANRRIDIRFTIRRPQSQDIREIQKQFSNKGFPVRP